MAAIFRLQICHWPLVCYANEVPSNDFSDMRLGHISPRLRLSVIDTESARLRRKKFLLGFEFLGSRLNGAPSGGRRPWPSSAT